jgi:hypothetical protein
MKRRPGTAVLFALAILAAAGGGEVGALGRVIREQGITLE